MLLFEQVVRQPNSLLSVVLSLTPIFGPILMFARIAVQMPPWWQIVVSLVLLVGTILGHGLVRRQDLSRRRADVRQTADAARVGTLAEVQLVIILVKG
jgi:hypothetical protein